MNFKKYLSFIILFVLLSILISCVKESPELTTIKEILNKYANTSAINIDYEIKNKMYYNDNEVQKLEFNHKSKYENKDLHSIVTQKVYSSEYVTYFVNDYGCSVNMSYHVDLDYSYEINAFNLFKFDFDNLLYNEKPTKKDNENTIYSVYVKGKKLKDKIKKLVVIQDFEIDNPSMDLSLEVEKSGRLKNMNILYTYFINGNENTTELNITIKSTGKYVEINIPTLVFLQIQYFIEGGLYPYPNLGKTILSKYPDTITEDKKLKTLETLFYTMSICDDEYIYTIDQKKNYLYIYELNTLENIHEETLQSTPISMDANNGRFVIGFANEIKVYNTSTWSNEVVTTKCPVVNTIIYNDFVFYGNISVYNMKTKRHEVYDKLGYNWSSLTIDREEEVLYFINYYYFSKHYIKEDRNEIFELSNYRTEADISFDGNFIHIDDVVYNKSGELISNYYVARVYQTPGVIKAATIYDDNSVSIFLGKRKDKYVTIVYDLTNDKILYEYEGTSTSAKKFNNKYIIFDDYSNIIRTLSTDL